MTKVTVKQLTIVENKTVCAAVFDSISYSRARLELFRDVGNELAINNDWATTPSNFRRKIINSATAGPIINLVKQLISIVLRKIVFTSICDNWAPRVIRANATKPSDIWSRGIRIDWGISIFRTFKRIPITRAWTIGILRKSFTIATPDFVVEIKLYNPYV